jgi:hypothetical protein
MMIMPSLVSHPKYMRLRKKIGPGAMEALVRLWGFCQLDQRGQCLGTMSCEDIEMICAWGGAPGDLYEALVSCKWLDVNEDGTVEAHDWDEANRLLTTNWANGRKMARAAKRNHNKGGGTAKAVPKQCLSSAGAPNPILSYPISEGVQGEVEPPEAPPPPDFQVPAEAEVLAVAEAYPGDLARMIPPRIPEAWALGWLNWRLREPSRFPADWQGDMVRSFVRDWVKELPDARGVVRGAKTAKTPFALKTQLEALELRIREHPGNPDSSSCSGDPTEEDVVEFRWLKRERADLIRKLSEGK